MVYVISIVVILAIIGLLLDLEKKRRKGNVLPATSKMDLGYRVDIVESGRYGDILYSEDGSAAKFGWEFGGNVLVVIDIPQNLRPSAKRTFDTANYNGL